MKGIYAFVGSCALALISTPAQATVCGDLNGDGVHNIVDVLLDITLAIGAPISPNYDTNGNGIPDTCDQAGNCGEGTIESAEGICVVDPALLAEHEEEVLAAYDEGVAAGQAEQALPCGEEPECSADSDCLPTQACQEGTCTTVPADGGEMDDTLWPSTEPTDCPDIGLDPSAGTIHYLCDCGPNADPDCVSGDDTNTGASPSQPWRSYDKMRTTFASLSPGDSFVLCRGGHFSSYGTDINSTRWVNSACETDNPCVIRDYDAPWGSGDEERPILSAQSNAFSFQDNGNANHEEGVVIMNINLQGSGTGAGFRFYNDMNDVLMCNVRIEGFYLGVHAAGANDGTPEPGSDAKSSNLVLRNAEVFNNAGQGWLGGCDGCGIAHSTFINNGFSNPTFTHNIYYSSGSGGIIYDMFAVGNELYQSTMFGGECRGTSLTVHGHKENLLIEGNYVHEDPDAVGSGCWGISVSTGYPIGELFTGVVIRNNRVENVGRMSIGVNACQDCLIENNVIVQTGAQGGSQLRVPSKTPGPEDAPLENVTVRNNSIYIGEASHARGVALGGNGEGHVVVNNAVVYAGSQSSNCLEMDLPHTSYDAIDHNLCYQAGSGSLSWAQGQDLSSWVQSSGFDQNSMMADPLFSDLDTGDLSPAPGSPLVDAGHPALGSSHDFLETPRDVLPDIGAYEAIP